MVNVSYQNAEAFNLKVPRSILSSRQLLLSTMGLSTIPGFSKVWTHWNSNAIYLNHLSRRESSLPVQILGNTVGFPRK